VTPSTGLDIRWTLLVNFSLPTWIYFAVADASPSGATIVQGIGLVVANALALAYLACAALTHGRRSVHDLLAGTIVEPGATG
jgi:hypothetical protein